MQITSNPRRQHERREDAERAVITQNSRAAIESCAAEIPGWEIDGDSRQSGDWYITSIEEATQ